MGQDPGSPEALPPERMMGDEAIVLNAKFDTYPMRKTIPAQENAGLVADDFFLLISTANER